VGISDCEHIGQGLLAQPVNTLTSLAYVAVGAVLVWRALMARSTSRIVLSVYAATVVAVGLGSVAFHGPMPSWGRVVHDASIASVLAFVIAYDVALVRGASRRAGLIGFGALLGACTVLLSTWPDISTALDSVLVVGAAVAEITVGRERRRLAATGGLVRDPAVWMLGAFVLAVGAVLNALGRTDAPLCEPDSLAQLHGVWHTLTAVVLWLYGVGVLEPRERARPIIPA
jgi:hypothetical protein